MVHDITRISDRHCRVVVALPVSPVISRVWPMDSPEIGRGDGVSEAAAVVFAGVMTTLKEFFYRTKYAHFDQADFVLIEFLLAKFALI